MRFKIHLNQEECGLDLFTQQGGIYTVSGRLTTLPSFRIRQVLEPVESSRRLASLPSSHLPSPTTWRDLDSHQASSRRTYIVVPMAQSGDPQPRFHQAEWTTRSTWRVESQRHRSSGMPVVDNAPEHLGSWWSGSVCEHNVSQSITIQPSPIDIWQDTITYPNQLHCPVIGPNVVKRKYSHFSKSTISCSESPLGPSTLDLS